MNSVERSIVEKDAAIYERNSRIRELSVQYSKQAQQIEQMMKQFQINKIQQNYQKSNQFKHSQTKQTNIEIQAYKEPAPAPATLTIQTIIPTIPTIAAHLPSVTAEHSPNSHSSSPRIPQPQTSLFSQADSMLDNRNQLNDIHVKSVQLLQKELQQNRSTIAELEHSLRSHQQNELKTSEYETNNHQPSQINHPQVQPIEQPTYPRPSTPSATIGDKSNSIDNPTNIDRIEAPHAVHTNNSSSNNQNLIFQEKANSQAAETSHQEQQLTQMKQKQFFLEQSIQSILEHINNPHQQTNKFSSNPLELAGNSLPHDQALQQNQPNESKSADSQSPSQSSHHPSPQHHHHNDDDHSHNIKCDHCHRHSKHRKKKPHRKHKGEKWSQLSISSINIILLRNLHLIVRLYYILVMSIIVHLFP